ncbi:MAG: hypothetical protein GY816_09675, partial [Cytophagales bacterium]|nr:hypothetical protein [Cytophagales bacterium]
NSVDIKSELYASQTPYQFAGNNPIFYNDPLGDQYSSDREEWLSQDLNYGYYSGRGSNNSSRFGDSWGNDVRSVEGNLNVMGRSGFRDYYGISDGFGGTDVAKASQLSSSLAESLSTSQKSQLLSGMGATSLGGNMWATSTNTAQYSNYGRMKGKVEIDAGYINFGGGNSTNPNASSGFWTTVAQADLLILGAGFSFNPDWSKPKNMHWNDFTVGKEAAKRIGNKISIAGALVGLTNFGINPTFGNSVDATFGIVGAVPGVGTIIGGIYGVLDIGTLIATGQGISDHIDDYMWITMPGSLTPMPIARIRNF